VLFYHSNIGLEIVGIAKVSKEAYPDPTADDDTWSAVDIKPFKALKKPVPLSLMKTDKSLKDMPLIRIGRLSVMPLTEAEYKRVMELAV
jgi:predicted RNA-binding protein with PUA-like domain